MLGAVLTLDLDKLVEDTNFLEWSLTKRLLRGGPFTILPPLKALYLDADKEVYIEKAAQVTVSEYLINLMLYCTDIGWGGRGNCLYIFPFTPQISDFSNARIEPVILESPYLRGYREELKLKHLPAVTNNMGLKQGRRGFAYLRGSSQRQNLISVDADVVIFDEVDEMEEGTIEAGKKRAGSAKFPFYRGASTPKYPKRGIDAIVERSDKKVWMVKCTRCTHEHDLARLQELIFELPKETSLLQVDPGPIGTYCHIGSRFYVACPKCGHVLNVWNGNWVSTYTDNPSYGGYHIPKLISDHLDFDDLAKRADDERHGRLSEVAIQEFWNSDLGLPRAPQGSQLQYQEIYQCCEGTPDDFYFKSDDWFSWIDESYHIGMSYIGIDVAVRRCHVAIIGFPSHNEDLRAVSPNNYPVLLAAGSVALLEKNTDGQELDPLIHKWQAMRAVIDQMPEYKMAASFRSRFPGRVYTCHYPKWTNKGNKIYEFEPQKKIGTVAAGRTETLDVVFDVIRQAKIVFPRNIQQVGGNINKRGFGEFPAHLMNTTRIIDKETNQANYDEGAAPDHLVHAINYAFIAAKYNPLNGEALPSGMIPDSIDQFTASATRETHGAAIFMQLGLTSTTRGGDIGTRRTQRSGGLLIGPGTSGYS